MPILKKEEAIPERPVIIALYGDPGIGKTSLFNTSPNPLLIDFDRGVDRAINRQDTLVVNAWEDVLKEEKSGTFQSYSTIGIDTAKAALDDFLMSYVIKQDYKNAKNKLAAYGALGDEFKVFVSNRRSEKADIVIIAHAKDEKEGDIIKKMPDVTGGSYQLLLRIADQVGYMTTINNKRVIQFEPTDRTIGKNVARLPIIEIPDENNPEFRTFMASIIQKTKEQMRNMSEAQRESEQKMIQLQEHINLCEDPEELTAILHIANEQPNAMKNALRKLIADRAKMKGFIVDSKNNCYALPPTATPTQIPGTNMNLPKAAPQQINFPA